MPHAEIPPKKFEKLYDKDIRTAVREKYQSLNLKDTVIVEEMNTGSKISRVDIVVINDYMTAIEIKGSEDRLDRLSGQIADYSRFFDQIDIYTVEKHINKVIELVPSYCGIYIVYNFRNKNRIKMIRKSTKIIEHSKQDLISLLWKKEMHKIAYNHGIIPKSDRYDMASIEFILNRDLNTSNLRAEITKIIKERLLSALTQKQYGD